MREIEEIVKEVAEIYRRSGREAEEYLHKARRLREKFGAGLAIVYCWFYSVPQKWTQVEPKIFELMKHTDSFNLDVILVLPTEKIASVLRPMNFYNEVSFQLKNFCKAIKDEYSSWNSFADAINKESIFTIFERLRKNRGIRVTFKNLATMKILIGMDDDLLILDTHVAKVLGINKSEQRKYRTQKESFKNLLKFSERITERIAKEGLKSIRMAKWSLAIWFDKAKIPANKLLYALNTC